MSYMPVFLVGDVTRATEEMQELVKQPKGASAVSSYAIGRGRSRSQDGGVAAVHVGRGEAAHWGQPPSTPS